MHPHWCFWVKFSWLDKIYLGPISITTRTGPNRPRSHLGLNWAKAGAVSSLLSAPELYQTVSQHYRRKKNTLSVSNTFTQKAVPPREAWIRKKAQVFLYLILIISHLSALPHVYVRMHHCFHTRARAGAHARTHAHTHTHTCTHTHTHTHTHRGCFTINSDKFDGIASIRFLFCFVAWSFLNVTIHFFRDKFDVYIICKESYKKKHTHTHTQHIQFFAVHV